MRAAIWSVLSATSALACMFAVPAGLLLLFGPWSVGLGLMLASIPLALVAKAADRRKMRLLYGTCRGELLHREDPPLRCVELARRDLALYRIRSA